MRLSGHTGRSCGGEQRCGGQVGLAGGCAVGGGGGEAPPAGR